MRLEVSHFVCTLCYLSVSSTSVCLCVSLYIVSGMGDKCMSAVGFQSSGIMLIRAGEK